MSNVPGTNPNPVIAGISPAEDASEERSDLLATEKPSSEASFGSKLGSNALQITAADFVPGARTGPNDIRVSPSPYFVEKELFPRTVLEEKLRTDEENLTVAQKKLIHKSKKTGRTKKPEKFADHLSMSTGSTEGETDEERSSAPVPSQYGHRDTIEAFNKARKEDLAKTKVKDEVRSKEPNSFRAARNDMLTTFKRNRPTERQVRTLNALQTSPLFYKKEVHDGIYPVDLMSTAIAMADIPQADVVRVSMKVCADVLQRMKNQSFAFEKERAVMRAAIRDAKIPNEDWHLMVQRWEVDRPRVYDNMSSMKTIVQQSERDLADAKKGLEDQKAITKNREDEMLKLNTSLLSATGDLRNSQNELTLAKEEVANAKKSLMAIVAQHGAFQSSSAEGMKSPSDESNILQSELAECNSAKARFIEEAAQLYEQVGAEQRKSESLEEANKELKSELRNAIKKNKSIERLLEQGNEKVKQLGEELTRMTKKEQSSLRKIKSLEKDLEDEKSVSEQWSDTNQKLLDENEERKKMVAQLERERDKAYKQRDQLHSTMIRSSGAISSPADRRSDGSDSISDPSSAGSSNDEKRKRGQLIEENTQLRALVFVHENTIIQLRKEHTGANIKYQTLERKSITAENASEKYRGDLAAANNEIKNLKQEVKSLKNDLIEATEGRDSIENNYQFLLEDMQAKFRDLAEANEELQQERDTLLRQDKFVEESLQDNSRAADFPDIQSATSNKSSGRPSHPENPQYAQGTQVPADLQEATDQIGELKSQINILRAKLQSSEAEIMQNSIGALRFHVAKKELENVHVRDREMAKRLAELSDEIEGPDASDEYNGPDELQIAELVAENQKLKDEVKTLQENVATNGVIEANRVKKIKLLNQERQAHKKRCNIGWQGNSSDNDPDPQSSLSPEHVSSSKSSKSPQNSGSSTRSADTQTSGLTHIDTIATYQKEKIMESDLKEEEEEEELEELAPVSLYRTKAGFTDLYTLNTDTELPDTFQLVVSRPTSTSSSGATNVSDGSYDKSVEDSVKEHDLLADPDPETLPGPREVIEIHIAPSADNIPSAWGKPGRTGKPGKVGRAKKRGRPEKPDEPEQPDKFQKPGKPGKPDSPPDSPRMPFVFRWRGRKWGFGPGGDPEDVIRTGIAQITKRISLRNLLILILLLIWASSVWANYLERSLWLEANGGTAAMFGAMAHQDSSYFMFPMSFVFWVLTLGGASFGDPGSHYLY